MTRIIALAGVAALLSGSVALAQTPPPPPGGPRPGPEAAAPPPPPPGAPRRGPDGPPPPPPARGAHLVLERGDARIDVKCAADDTTKACADIALQLIDKLATVRPDAR